jgi:uncharacterized membrane protein
MQNTTSESRTAYHLVMFTFDGIETARAVHDRLREEGALDGVEIEADAVVSRDRDGKVELHERGSAGVGAALGIVTAGIVGFVTGPVLLLAMVAVGGLVGGIAGHFAGQILPPDDLREIADSLRPGSSAYLAVVDSPHAEAIVAAFAAEGARILDVPVETEISSVLREGISHRVTRV